MGKPEEINSGIIMACYINYVKEATPKDIRTNLLESIWYVYANSSLNLWINASGVPFYTKTELKEISNSIKTLTKKYERSKDEQMFDKLRILTGKYKVNEIWKHGENLSNVGYFLLSDKYINKAYEILEEISPEATDYEKDLFVDGLGQLISRWVFGEPINIGGASKGFSDFKQKYFRGMTLLEVGPIKYDTHDGARSRNEKRSTDMRYKAVHDGGGFTYL